MVVRKVWRSCVGAVGLTLFTSACGSHEPRPTSPSRSASSAAPVAGSVLPWPTLRDHAVATREGTKDSAIVVAIEDYVFLSDVPGAVENGEAWARYFVKARGIDPDRVSLLFNSEATNFAIMDAAEKMAARAEPGGTIWFVFIGHGAPNEQLDDGLLVAADAQQSVLGLEHRSIKQSELLAQLEKSPATPVAVVDACFSGRNRDGAPLIAGLQPSAVVRQLVPTRAIVMSAARANQFAGPLPGATRPAFSYLVLGGLRGWADDNNDGRVTTAETIRYAGETLRILLGGSRNQTPELLGADAAIATSKERGPDVGAFLLRLKAPGTQRDSAEVLRQLDVVCPVGARWDGTRCVHDEVVSAVSCPGASKWDGSACVVTTVQCPNGSEWDGSACRARSVKPSLATITEANNALKTLDAEIRKKFDASKRDTGYSGSPVEVLKQYQSAANDAKAWYNKLQTIVTGYSGTPAATLAIARQGELYDTLRTALSNTRTGLRLFDAKSESVLKRAEASDNPDLQEKADAVRIQVMTAWRERRDQELAAVDAVIIERYTKAYEFARSDGLEHRAIAWAALQLWYYERLIGARFEQMFRAAGGSQGIEAIKTFGETYFVKHPDRDVVNAFEPRCATETALCEGAGSCKRSRLEMCDLEKKFKHAQVKP
jgi:hypothetical protein